MNGTEFTNNNLVELLQFYIDAGIDECSGETSPNRLNSVIQTSPTPSVPTIISMKEKPLEITSKGGTKEFLKEANEILENITSLDELKLSLETFEGFVLKRTSKHLLFAEGNPKSGIMIIGDNPGAEEDMSGKLFVGKNGSLLDKMLASIGLDREETAYLTYLINWYPPGNRIPSENEIALAIPFIQKHIELIEPKIIICLGDISAKNILSTPQSVSRIHGKWHEYKSAKMKTPAAVMPFFRPEYLLASPIHKSLAWEDLLKIKEKLLS